MDSRNIFFFFIVVTFLCFATIEAQDISIFLYKNCSSNVTTSNSPFQLNLRKLLSSLSSNVIGDTQFYNTTVTGRDSSDSDSVYGLFMCRGDVTSQVCHNCVITATQRLLAECSLSKQAVISYEECMIRYSNRFFFSTGDTRPRVALLSTANVSNPVSFMRLLFSTMNKTADEAANSSSHKKFATMEANVSENQTLYCLVQCTQDLTPHDCRTCLSGAIEELPRCCDGKLGGRVLHPSCNVRYELYPFYRTSPTPAPALVPATSGSEAADSKISEDPVYLSNICSSSNDNQTIITPERRFKRYLKILLSYLSSNATDGKRKIFHKATANDMLYGLYMCRGDLPPRLCRQCVQNATHRITSKCQFQEAIIWYSHCLVRYSNRNFISTVDVSPMYSDINITTSSSSSTILKRNSFTSIVSNQLAQLAKDIGDSGEKYMTKSLKLNDAQTLYSLGQCTQDLSSNDCTACLEAVIETNIPWPRLGSVGGRVLYPSCNLRFELFQFYRDTDQDQPPKVLQGTPPPPEKRNDQGRTIILIVVPTIILVLVFSFGYYLLRKKGRKSRRTILQENFGHESATLEPLQFDLFVIQTATNNFSDDNYLGKGGFGEVYKGILFDGRQIAVKRLSESSKQGVEEFKNEVLLIAKLQHRNLVAFIGFCLEEQEKMLIYEFVPNKSLDYVLFDSKRQKSLSWVERYNIIGGIARGILYLHEHSRLKVIHRDLKPSNILLDENMIPKISDFGLARIVEISQDQGSTNRIVGTHGYMSPEYIMLGQFSEKSDVFSFGVMILEIVAGKKNRSLYGHRGADGLLNYVWRQWSDLTPLSILDPNIKDDYSKVEVIKCIQIGLLCVQHNPDARPTMATVVSYLGSYSIELPTPQEPAFFFHSRMDSNATQESSSTRSASSSALFSINEMPTSAFHPR